MKTPLASTAAALFLPLLICLAPDLRAEPDWPQWRGPLRNGVVPESPALPAELTDETAPRKIWESEAIPSDHDGGHGSVAVTGGKVYLSVVWHRDVATETRRIDGAALSNLNFRGTESIPAEVVAEMEHERENLGRRLRGAALDEWAKKWVEDHLDPKTQLSLGGWVIGRFKQGKSAIPLTVFETLRTVGNREFANQAEMEAWVREQGFAPDIEAQIVKAVPQTKKEANDVVLCLDADTGREAWKFDVPGYPSGRSSSSTPAVVDGKVYAALSTHLYCLDAADGAEVWRAELTGRKGPASSPLVLDGRVFLQQNLLTAFDASTGKVLWQNKDVAGANQSPAYWTDGADTVIVCNAAKEVIGVSADTGETLWKQPGGGDGTPAVSGNTIIVSSRLDGQNLIAYRVNPGSAGPELLWSHDFLARRYGSSPIIYEGNVYHLGSERHLCVDLATGDIRWERKASSSISSPLLADGKLFVYENNGGFIGMLAADPAEYRALGRAKVGALYCASPALVGKRLYLRTRENVACYEFP